MINPHQVVQAGSVPHSLDPPLVACLLMVGPVIQGIAPQLAVLAEIIRRDAGDVRGHSVLVDQQHLRMGPGIGAVQRDIDRHVAKQANTFCGGRFP